MPKHDYLFVDESGDPGYRLDPASGELLSSPHYVAAVLHVTDDAFVHINRHMAAFRYYSGMNRELKLPRNQDTATRLLQPVAAMVESGVNVWASAVFMDKQRYSGGYLGPQSILPESPTKFRNFVLRLLLEHHFEQFPLKTEQYDLVLDRVEMTKGDRDNLELYLAQNLSIPTPRHVTHASSIYVDGLQIVHHIANGYRDVPFGHDIPGELGFVSARDITSAHDTED